MASFTTLGSVSMSLIPSLGIFYVVVTNGFLEDMILVLDMFYLVCFKTKVIYPQQSTTRNESPVIQIFSFKNCFITQIWSNYLFLVSLGNPSEDNNRNFARRSLNYIFLFNQFHQLKRTTKILQEVPPGILFSLRLRHSRIRVRF